jgi:hypothetical protein
LAIDPNIIACLRIGICGNVGNATARVAVVGRRGNLRVSLIRRRREDAANAATRGAGAGTIVPDNLVGDRAGCTS